MHESLGISLSAASVDKMLATGQSEDDRTDIVRGIYHGGVAQKETSPEMED